MGLPLIPLTIGLAGAAIGAIGATALAKKKARDAAKAAATPEQTTPQSATPEDSVPPPPPSVPQATSTATQQATMAAIRASKRAKAGGTVLGAKQKPGSSAGGRFRANEKECCHRRPPLGRRR
jgi:hypothetical protein